MNRVSVLVSAIGGGGHGEQILKALRLAGPERYMIIGGDASEACPQFSLVDVPVILPRANDPLYIEALLGICRRYDVRAVFHGCEPDLIAMARARDEFERLGILVPINPDSVLRTCMDKSETARFLSENGFKTPRSAAWHIDSPLPNLDIFPLVIKPSVGSGGSQNVFIVQSKSEVSTLSEYLKKSGSEWIIQEYVGTHKDEYTIGVLFDLDGDYVNSIATHRLLTSSLNIKAAVRNTTGRAELGEWLIVSSGVSQGYVGHFPDITAPCVRIARALGARGAINVQARQYKGELYVFEINPRFSGTTSLRAMMGFNEPDLLVRQHVFGEKPQRDFPYREGCIIRTLLENILPSTPIKSWPELTGGAA
jgi:carbamoyl-phosphate synthase large subunit